MIVTGKAVARVNGAVLTDRDLLREMFSLFPYARQHNGFPKAQEAEIRQGALQMIEFEELVYQEAQRRKMTVAPERLQKAERQFMRQFDTREAFQNYLRNEWNGSRTVMRQQIRRSLLIEDLLKIEVASKCDVTNAEAKIYYDKNPKLFSRPETFTFQSISIMPKDTASNAVKQEARKRAEDALAKAKATKDYEGFGLLAEKVSEDDFRVNMGLHRAVPVEQMIPEILNAARSMKPGEISGILQLGTFYTFFRLEAHTPAGKDKFDDVKLKLRKNLRESKRDFLRASLNKRLRQHAQVVEM